MKIDKVYEAMFKKIKRGKTPTGLTMHPDTIKVLMDKCGVVETEPFVLQSIRGYPIYENRYMIMNCCKIDFDDGSFGMLNL